MTPRQRLAALNDAGQKATQHHVGCDASGAILSAHDILGHMYRYDDDEHTHGHQSHAVESLEKREQT